MTTVIEKKISVEEENILRFVDEINKSSNFEILGTARNDTVFVLKDKNKDEGIEGVYLEIAINEIMEKIVNKEKAQEFISVLKNERNSIILHGVTRIVGYYSRVTNWNSSKREELRQRMISRVDGGYILGKEKPVFINEAISYLDNLSDMEYAQDTA